jgi:uncharacterized protein (TIGR03546 family)
MGERLESLMRALSSRNQPWQTAGAVALGCACGLLPKTSLLFPLSVALVYLLPLHLPIALVSMLLSSCIAPYLYPIHGAIGGWVLSLDSVARSAQRMDQMPWMPWLRLNNTIVAGSLSLSAVLIVPTYLAVHHFLLMRHTRWLAKRSQFDFELSMQRKLEALQSLKLQGNKPLVSRLEIRKPAMVAPQVEPKPLASSQRQVADRTIHPSDPDAANVRIVDSIHALETLLESGNLPQTETVDTESILKRAARAAELVDDLVHAMDAEWIQRTDLNHSTKNFKAHDTAISISIRSDSVPTTKMPKPGSSAIESHSTFSKEPMIRTSHPAVISPPAPKRSLGTISEDDSLVQAHQTATRNVEIRHEEALRHLLNHLRSIREEV